ncbi:hypothetical protein HHL26_23755 [Sphingobium sp. TB-6]|uniref:hypothetical protein n=1 Tax=Sphingobium sp. TB-6 TaxID=2728850 RepID=UPI00146B0D49|nr:hypothetical protein [Sphingobium sp. TB-6]NML92018.1 hypothetical protein [Sphingobium sp. TB-6]
MPFIGAVSNISRNAILLLIGILIASTPSQSAVKNKARTAPSINRPSFSDQYKSAVSNVKTCDDYLANRMNIPSVENHLGMFRSWEESRKDEFETTQSFNSRNLSKFSSYIGSTKIIIKKKVDVTYDMDNQQIKIHIPFEPYYYDMSLSLGMERAGALKKYVGQNGYGAQARVTSSDWSELYLTFDNLRSRDSEIILPMKPVDAISLKNSGKLEIVSELISPFLTVLNTHDSPTISRPFEHRTKITQIRSNLLCLFLTWDGGIPISLTQKR